MHGINVVNIDDIRVARGVAKYEKPTCRHRNLTYSTDERRVYCTDCKSTIDNFDAFMNLVKVFNAAKERCDRKESELNDALKYNVRRLAAKKLDEAWSSRTTIPCCPHELARRKKLEPDSQNQ